MPQVAEPQIQKGKKYRLKTGRTKFVRAVIKNDKAPGGANVYHCLVREDGSISQAESHNDLQWFQERVSEEVA